MVQHMIHTLVQQIRGGQAASSAVQEASGVIVTEAQHEGHGSSGQQLCSACIASKESQDPSVTG